jgi:hypothetical protein
MRQASALAALLLVALACNAAAPQWKWRDVHGRINASDLPPPASVPDRDILSRPNDPRHRVSRPEPTTVPPAAASAPRPAAAPTSDPELDARRKRAADEQLALQKQQQAKDAAVRGENCDRARGQLTALSEGQRMTRTNAQGEREVLDDKARAEEMQRARAIIASDCH